MKTHRCLIIYLTVLAFTSAFGQQLPTPVPVQPPRSLPPPAAPAPIEFNARLKEITERAAGTPSPAPSLTKFNLDFPGGTPKELVAAIQKAMGKPLNAIISDEQSNVELPPLKMNNVDVTQLFQALRLASVKTEVYVTGTYSSYGFRGSPNQSYQAMETSYGFKTSGTPTDDSIWYFYIEKPNLAPLIQNKVCRFYSLSLYLERGLTVDDITTAIETGWKMLGDKETPTISFHKDTKLLIAVGEPSKLETIDAVLKALEPPAKPLLPGVVPKQEPTAKPAEKPTDNQ